MLGEPQNAEAIMRMNNVILQETRSPDSSKANLNKPLILKPRMTYFGERPPFTQIYESKNMYQTIKSLNLGNLSSLAKIPEFYIRFLIGFVIQVSKTLSHMHKYDLAHGKFDLSRVLVKKMKISEKAMNKYESKR